MDRIGTCLDGGPDVLGRVEIRRDLDRPVRPSCVKRAAVVRCDDGDCLDAEARARAEHANGDLAAVRNE